MAYGDAWERESDELWRRYSDALWLRRSEEEQLEPDDRLDEIGHDIFFCASLRGAGLDEAARLAMDGNLRQRKRVRDDMFRRLVLANRHRYRELNPRAADPGLEPLEAEDQLEFWSSRLTSPEYVYFIQEGGRGPVKIGLSNRPKRRIGDLQTGNPTELHLRHVVPGDRRTEAVLHHRFEPARIRGEWFGDVIDADYLAIILAFAEGLAEEMVHRYDGSTPVLMHGASIRTPTEVERIRSDIARLWARGHVAADIAEVLKLVEGEVAEHLDAMRGNPLYGLRRSNAPIPIYRMFNRKQRPKAA
jgi:hypothetical protein